jgi:hypothetical protein
MQIRVTSADTGRTVGLYRFPQTKVPPFDATIPGVVEGGEPYNVTVYVDVNGNEEYDNPATGGVDRGWCIERTADLMQGLVFDFDPSLAGDGTCDVGAP